MEDLHGDLGADTSVDPPQLLILDGNVTFQPLSGEDALLVDGSTDPAHDPPVSDGDGDTEESDEEKVPGP